MTPFPLQTVLDVRKSLEERSLMDFVEEVRRLKAERERLRGLQGQVSDALALLRGLKERAVEAMEMEMHLLHVRRCRVREQEQQAVVERSEGAVRERRERLLQAMKERKVVETLRDRHDEEQKREQDTREQAALDERSVLGSRRKKP